VREDVQHLTPDLETKTDLV